MLSRETEGFRVGESFTPHRKFNGILIPEQLTRSRLVSPSAKLVWGRLARYAGQNGHCFPAVATLASEVGLGKRQVQKCLKDLERVKLIRRVSRFTHKGQTSNTFEFLWHEIFASEANDCSGKRVNNCASGTVNDCSQKESQEQENQLEEEHDLDCLPKNQQTGVTSVATSSGHGRCRQYPKLREALAGYMAFEDDEERIYPRERLVVDVMDAAGGASEDEVVGCLQYLFHERGLKPRTKQGPRHFSWFKTVVADYFQQRRDRDFIIDPGRFAYRTPSLSTEALC